MLQHLMKWEILLEYEPEIIQVQRVYWKQDFGPWKRGQYCHYLIIHYGMCTIKELDMYQRSVKECQISLSVECNHDNTLHEEALPSTWELFNDTELAMRAERIVQLFLKHQLEKAVPIEVYNAIGMLKSGLQMRGFKCVPS
jgi:hypothetical protein